MKAAFFVLFLLLYAVALCFGASTTTGNTRTVLSLPDGKAPATPTVIVGTNLAARVDLLAKTRFDPGAAFTIVLTGDDVARVDVLRTQLNKTKDPKTKDLLNFQIYQVNASAGDPWAQFWLAKYYAQGKGTAVDKDKAFLWAASAARNGHPAAQMALGVAYAFGDDFVSAVRKTISDNQIDGLFLAYEAKFRQFFEGGTGTGRDYKTSWAWLKLASDDPDTFPEIFLVSVESMLDDTQLKDAQAQYATMKGQVAPSLRKRPAARIIATRALQEGYLRATQPWLSRAQ